MQRSALQACVSYEEEDTCVSMQRSALQACVSYEEEDTCVSMQRSALQACVCTCAYNTYIKHIYV
jgi:hypothetical protein